MGVLEERHTLYHSHSLSPSPPPSEHPSSHHRTRLHWRPRRKAQALHHSRSLRPSPPPSEYRSKMGLHGCSGRKAQAQHHSQSLGPSSEGQSSHNLCERRMTQAQDHRLDIEDTSSNWTAWEKEETGTSLRSCFFSWETGSSQPLSKPFSALKYQSIS